MTTLERQPTTRDPGSTTIPRASPGTSRSTPPRCTSRCWRSAPRHPDARSRSISSARRPRFGELGKAINAFAGALQKQFGIRKGIARRADAAQHAVLRHRLLRACCAPAARWSTATRSTPSTSSATSPPMPAPTCMVTLDLEADVREGRGAGRGRARQDGSSSATSPTPCRGVKKLLYSVAKRKDLAELDASPDRRQGRPVRRADRAATIRPTPVAIDRRKRRRGAAIYRRHHRPAQGRHAEPRQHRRQHEPDRQVGLRAVQSARARSSRCCRSSTSSR